MYSFLTVKLKRKKLKHGLTLCLMFNSAFLMAQVNRLPANYIPNDDLEVKPVDNEISLYKKYVQEDESADVVTARNQLKIWNDNQAFADQYGMDSSMAGQYYVPSSQEKWKYFNDRYLKYMRRRGEQPLQQMPKTWYDEFRASNEVDTIDEMENRFKSTQGKAQGSESSNGLPEPIKAKEVSVWKKTTFVFQPRVERGLVYLGMKSPIANARAWVGVNGKTEVNVERSFDTIGMRTMVNYYTDTGNYFTSLDKRITDNIYARITSDKDIRYTKTNDAIMLQYAKSF